MDGTTPNSWTVLHNVKTKKILTKHDNCIRYSKYSMEYVSTLLTFSVYLAVYSINIAIRIAI